MMRQRVRTHGAVRALIGAVAFTLGACASAPVHYYTLVAPAAGSADPTMTVSGDVGSFQLVMGGAPADVDEPEFVVREGRERAAIIDGERWIGPLHDQLRAALSAELARDLPGVDVTDFDRSAKRSLLVKVEVRRFESAPGSYALIEAAWSVQLAGEAGDRSNTGDAVKATSLLCSSSLRESVGAGYPELVRGHQRALQRLGGEIAAAGRALWAGKFVSCAAPRG